MTGEIEHRLRYCANILGKDDRNTSTERLQLTKATSDTVQDKNFAAKNFSYSMTDSFFVTKNPSVAM